MFRVRLEEALGRQTLQFSPTTLERLEALDGLVARWGRAVRLVGFRSRDERVRRYFAEALALLEWLPERGRALDIGSGGGSPALPLAIARPSVAWTLVEANERKALFLLEVVESLGLSNVAVVRERYENVEPAAPLDAVSIRGVAAGPELLGRVGAQLAPAGRLLWISSEARLTAGREALTRTWAQCTGPMPLIRDGGLLLVAEVRR